MDIRRASHWKIRTIWPQPTAEKGVAEFHAPARRSPCADCTKRTIWPQRGSCAFAALIVGVVLAGAPCAAQSMRPEDVAQGKILVTPRDSPDPHFANSVILLARYDASGALGLMIHYRSDLTAKKMLNGIKGIDNRADKLYVGGPVEIPVVFALLRNKSAPEGGRRVTGNLYLMTSRQSIGAALANAWPEKDLRLFIGYSGWGPGQLEREVRRSGWYIFDYDESLVFDEHPETLWDRLIAKADRRLASAPGGKPAPAAPSGLQPYLSSTIRLVIASR
jgi:putative transcriptional regulator